MREQKANDNGFPVVGKQVKEQQTFPFDQLVQYDGATNKITINANVTINGDTNIGELDIDSGDAPKGQVLTADGESGASWENRVEYLNLESESGNLTDEQIEVAKQDNAVIQLGGQFYYKNSQSDESIVFKAPAKVVDDDTIVEKVVVDLSDNTYSYSYEVVATGGSFVPVYDDEINDSSTNAVQNKTIYEELEQYAKKDGYYENFGYARRSGVADNLFNEEGKLLDPNVSESAGTVYVDQPFVQRATAMTMNAYLNDELISVASGVEEWKKDEAFSIVRNQLVNTGDTEVQTISDHKYLTFINGIYAFSTSSGSAIVLNDASADKVIDLTQWFASRPAIATALSGDNGVKWFLQQYPEALSLEHDDGTIIDTETYEYQTTGVNLWNEVVEQGSIDATTGQNITSTLLRSKNYTRVFPNTTYHGNYIYRVFFYDINENYISYVNLSDTTGAGKTFTTPINCAFIRFNIVSEYGTTYKNDIQICNHFTQTQIEQTYHKFDIHKDTVDWSWTSTGKGKSAGSAADTKDYVLGKNIEKVGSVDLGSLDYTYTSSSGRSIFRTTGITNLKKQVSTSQPINAICPMYNRTTQIASWVDKDMAYYDAVGFNSIAFVNNDYTDAAAFKAAMSGVILNFELATPIEYDMSGDENIATVQENDYGNEVKVSASGNMFSGSATTILYQDNVLRQIYNNKNNIDGLQEDVNTLEAKIPDAPTNDGTYVLKATVSGGVATYSWVLEE